MQPLQLDQVLTLKPSIRAEAVDADSIFLIGERQRFLLADPRVVKIAALIDGKRAVQDILAQAGPEIPEAQALYILGHLTQRGYLVGATPALPREVAAFWHGIGLDAQLVVDRLREQPVRVRSIAAPELAGWMVEALAHTGVRLDDAAATQLIVTDDYLRPELAELNAEARRRGTSWFVVQPVGTRPLIGPLFRSDAGPCWECLAFWLRNNRPVEELVRRHNGGAWVPAPSATIGASARAAAGLAAIAFVRALTAATDGPAPAERSHLLAVDLATFQTSTHAVIRRPQCAACGDPGLTAAITERPIALESAPKRHVSDGGYRQSPPEETWDRYGHLVSSVCGPVSYVVPVPERNTDLRAVYASGYLICPRAGAPRRNTFDKMCAGKGRAAAQARASALCEALERFSGVWQGDEARVRASAKEMGAIAVHPGAITNFSDAQYRDRARTLPETPGRHRVPEPLDDDIAVDWTPAWSLTRGHRRYVPFTYCYAESPTEAGTAYCDPCGNGTAAGTCLEEAILQGLLELVERDAVGIWWYSRAPRPGVALDSFGDPYFAALRSDYARLGWELSALDLTHDLGIPTFVALAHHVGEDRFAIGFGSHLDARLGLQRALTEVNQLFDPGAARRAPWDLDAVADRAYLFADPRVRPIEASGYAPLGGADLRTDIECCLDRLHAAGLEVLAVNKTRPDIGLSVAQMIVPGLRHFWPRFGPGRLYDVPHRLGWLAKPLREADLNPVPLLV